MVAPMQRLTPVDFTHVQLADTFWAPRMDTNRRVTMPIQYEHLQKTGRIAGIDPDYKPGDSKAHHIFWDSDVAKWIETASYSLATRPDPAVERQVDEVIAKFAKLQCSDGYINSWFTAVEPEKRFTNLRDKHELYCAGHLIEAAVAYYRATKKRAFLDMMCRYADYIDSVFGWEEGRRRGYCGHAEIELALVKLYHATGEQRYLKLAQFFIDERGQQPHYYDLEAKERGEVPENRPRDYRYNQSHMPVREQTKVVGHAVRAMYLYCGMVDVALETDDQSLLSACAAIWQDLYSKNMYITGGIGQTRQNEGFTFDYDFPEETAYCETCAAVGFILWNHRLLQIHGESRFADCMERALYNGAISGWALSGDRFFYDNPLASLGQHHRQEWFGCACCPGNISRLLASIGGLVYSESEDAAMIHLYAESEGRLTVGGQQVVLQQETAYPWDGRIVVHVEPEKPVNFTLALRIPGWCRQADVTVNGQLINVTETRHHGYVRITRQWQAGDVVTLQLAMPVERVRANPQVHQANGKVALQRGPIVYCLEEVDNPVTPLNRIALPRSAAFQTRYEPELLGGVTLITAEANVIVSKPGAALYSVDTESTAPFTITAVPYSVWDNRKPGQMLVWIREC